MTRDEALEQAIAACTALMSVSREYYDIQTAAAAMHAQRLLLARRSPEQIARMEAAAGLTQCQPR
jgi:hypothetical protein